MNRWKLSKKIKDKYLSMILEHINKLQNLNLEFDNPYKCELDLSDTELNPYTLCEILESIGYERTYQEDNGWQLDFLITFRKKNCRPLQVRGTGLICEFYLSGLEDDDSDVEVDEIDEIDAKELDELYKKGTKLLDSIDEILKNND